jgi:hypothetical protein
LLESLRKTGEVVLAAVGSSYQLNAFLNRQGRMPLNGDFRLNEFVATRSRKRDLVRPASDFGSVGNGL